MLPTSSIQKVDDFLNFRFMILGFTKQAFLLFFDLMSILRGKKCKDVNFKKYTNSQTNRIFKSKKMYKS